MPVVVAVDGDRVGIVQKRPPAKDGDVELALQGTGKGRETRALQDHGPHGGALW
jgi:hypothetical protein